MEALGPGSSSLGPSFCPYSPECAPPPRPRASHFLQALQTRSQLIRVYDGEGLDRSAQLEEEGFYLGNQLGSFLQIGDEIAATLAFDVAEVGRLGLEVADDVLHRLPDASVLD